TRRSTTVRSRCVSSAGIPAAVANARRSAATSDGALASLKTVSFTLDKPRAMLEPSLVHNHDNDSPALAFARTGTALARGKSLSLPPPPQTVLEGRVPPVEQGGRVGRDGHSPRSRRRPSGASSGL